MSTGSRRSLHIPPLEDDRRPPPAQRSTTPKFKSHDQAGEAVNPLLALGSLLREDRTISDILKALHLNESEYHGSLQVLLSTLKHMQATVTAMLEACER